MPLPTAPLSRAATASRTASRRCIAWQKRAFALVPRKSQQNAGAVQRYLPYLPPELTKDTTKFLHSDPCCKDLLSLVFSPAEKSVEHPSPIDNEEDRKEYEVKRAEYLRRRMRFKALLRENARMLEKSTFDAVENLPADLYAEAVGSDHNLSENNESLNAYENDENANTPPAGAFLREESSADKETNSRKKDSEKAAQSTRGCFTGKLDGCSVTRTHTLGHFFDTSRP
jgi:hypothetical protein